MQNASAKSATSSLRLLLSATKGRADSVESLSFVLGQLSGVWRIKYLIGNSQHPPAISLWGGIRKLRRRRYNVLWIQNRTTIDTFSLSLCCAPGQSKQHVDLRDLFFNSSREEFFNDKYSFTKWFHLFSLLCSGGKIGRPPLALRSAQKTSRNFQVQSDVTRLLLWHAVVVCPDWTYGFAVSEIHREN